MSVLLGRGDWRPGYRIESLRRYAFIGDSNAYGSGVAPDQTLPAHAEGQMNQLLPAWPVEAVNLGVGGYNLWNSWLAFKDMPQVYSGVVLVLCHNDADLFGRTYRVGYPERFEVRWEGTHPFGGAVARCFDDIAAFSQELSVPVAVVYYNIYNNQGELRIAEIVGDLCASRGFCFIDAFVVCRERNFAGADLVVSSSNFHPSAMAHEAVGRQLAATLKRQGWFEENSASAIGAAPDRILGTAEAMVQSDHYPPDAALNWALGALDAKSRLARRLQASGADDDFSAAAARTGKVLATASRRWHTVNRVRALVGDAAFGGHGIASGLFRVEEERLRLEELCFTLGTGDWNRLTARLLEAEPPRPILQNACPLDAASFLDGGLEFVHFREALDALRSLGGPAAIGSPFDGGSMLADLDALERLAARVQEECGALKAAFLRLESVFNEARRSLSEAHIAYVSNLIGAWLEGVKEVLRFVARLPAELKRIRDANCASFTTVEITIRGEVIEGRPVCIIAGQAEYSVPDRLPFNNNGAFWPDGEAELVTLYFPIFYAGRLILRPFNNKASTKHTVEATLIKVAVYNGKNQRRLVEPASFYKDRAGRFVSPLIYVP